MSTKFFKNSLSIFLAILLTSLSLFGCEMFTDTVVSEVDSDDSSTTNSKDIFDIIFGNESSSDEKGPSNDSENSEISDVSTPPSDTVVSFLACPDNLIHSSIFYDAIQRAAAKNNTKPVYTDLHNATYDFSPIYEFVAEDIKNADISYINQETLIGGTSGRIGGYPCFNSPNDLGETLIDLGFDVVNVAHNHMLDSGNTKYLEHCNNFFESQGVDVLGYYPDQVSTENITVIEKKGIKVAFLAYTYSTNGIKLSSSSKFVIPYFDKALLTKQVKIAKEIADIVIVSSHWGVEGTYNINSEQKKYAKIMNDLEVDVILGMHPHVIQPIEWLTSESGYKTLAVYSLGNFVSGMYHGMNMLAGMLSLDIVRDGETGEVYIDTPLFIPTVTHYTKSKGVSSSDTGFRNFKIYPLKDYTQELASQHGVVKREQTHASTLVGGKFSLKTLNNTLYKYIPEEFLPLEYKTE